MPQPPLSAKIICHELARLLLKRRGTDEHGPPVESVAGDWHVMYFPGAGGLQVAVRTQPMQFSALLASRGRGTLMQAPTVSQGGADTYLPLDEFSRLFLQPAAAVLYNCLDGGKSNQMKRLLLVLTLAAIQVHSQRPAVTVRELSAQEQDRIRSLERAVDDAQAKVNEAVARLASAEKDLVDAHESIGKTFGEYTGPCANGKVAYRNVEVEGKYAFIREGESPCVAEGASFTSLDGSSTIKRNRGGFAVWR